LLGSYSLQPIISLVAINKDYHHYFGMKNLNSTFFDDNLLLAVIIKRIIHLAEIAEQKTITIHRTVLFGDCDPEGIVYTPRFSYFAVEAIQDALTLWLEDDPSDSNSNKPKSGGLRKLMGYDILPPARAFNLEFHHPVTWDDELSIDVSVDKITERSFSFAVKARLENSRISSKTNILAFTAHLTQVCMSRETNKSIPLPSKLKQRLTALLS